MKQAHIQSTALRNGTLFFPAIVAAALIIGLIHSGSLRYLSDDAFVSFRYAKNLVAGNGLVYNAAERVEGYTNFLWTMLIAAGMKLGAAPESLAPALGILFSLLTIALFGFLSWKSRGWGSGSGFFIPLTAMALALHRDFNAHATSGLETGMFTFLVSASFAGLLLARSAPSMVGTGILFVLAMMTRPDGAIFLGAAIVYLFLAQGMQPKKLLLLLFPTLVLYLPYWLWRWQYYGFFFPNTFYAKSVNLSYYSQGIEFAALYLKTYYVFLLPLILGGVLLLKRVQRGALPMSISPRPGGPRPVLLGTLWIACYAFYIIRIGGDFMFARFFIPITPLLYFVTEMLLMKVQGQRMRLVLAGAVLAGTFFRADQYGDQSFVGYVADERRYFTVDEPLSQSRADAGLLGKYMTGLPVKVAFWAGQLRLVYYLDPPLAIECTTGLTDSAIAHQAISERGRPGHEKNATLSYLERRKVNFYIGPTEAPPPGELVLNFIAFEDFRSRIIVYENAVMDRLAAFPEVKFVRMPEYLDNYIAEMNTYPPERIRQDYQFFKSYYFDNNNDPRRREVFLARLAAGALPERTTK